jgi:hypothetical protein
MSNGYALHARGTNGLQERAGRRSTMTSTSFIRNLIHSTPGGPTTATRQLGSTRRSFALLRVTGARCFLAGRSFLRGLFNALLFRSRARRMQMLGGRLAGAGMLGLPVVQLPRPFFAELLFRICQFRISFGPAATLRVGLFALDGFIPRPASSLSFFGHIVCYREVLRSVCKTRITESVTLAKTKWAARALPCEAALFANGSDIPVTVIGISSAQSHIIAPKLRAEFLGGQARLYAIPSAAPNA